jgi:SRSO17 transposase
MQRLLTDAVWDADAVRDDLRRYVADELGEPDGLLVLDDTGDLKRGTQTVGVQRQYTGTAGKIENAQVAVFAAYVSSKGRALVDRDIYLPRAWTDDPRRMARMACAGVPAGVGFASKVTLGRRMLARAFDAGMPAAWVTADEFYGGERGLRRDLQERQVGYVLAVARSHHIDMPIGHLRADQAAGRLHRRCWNRLSAGQGAKGERVYDWALLQSPHPPTSGADTTGCLSADAAATVSWPSTAAGHPDPSPSPNWSKWPAADGRSRSASKRPRARSVSTSTRSAASPPLARG